MNWGARGLIAGGAAIAVLAGTGAAIAQQCPPTGPWTAPAAEKSKKSAVPPSAKAVTDGKNVAQVNCVTCHGATGKGNGPAAVALNPKPADWTSARVQDESDGELFWKISNGRCAMPPWKHLPEADRWSVIQFIRSLKK